MGGGGITGGSDAKMIKLFKEGKKGLKKGSHTDAVMCLNVHPKDHNFLASGSADHTVKIWDIERTSCVNTLSRHTEKVQIVKWNPIQQQVIFSAGYDKLLAIQDIRGKSDTLTTKVNHDVEQGMWSMHDEHYIVVSSEGGEVLGYDAR